MRPFGSDFLESGKGTKMVGFISILFGVVKKSAKQRRDERRQKNRKLHIEPLEPRQLLAAGTAVVEPPVSTATSANYVQVANQRVPQLDILPGGLNKVLASMTVRTVIGQVSRLTSMEFVGVAGRLSWDTNGLRLMADMNGRASDGCETAIAYGNADYNDVVQFNVNQAFWVGKTARKVQVVGNFNSRFNSDEIAVEIAGAGFCDTKGRAVAENNVRYTGVATVIHKLESAGMGISQRWQPETSVVYAGEEGVTLVALDAWTNLGEKPILVQRAEFVAKGNPSNFKNFSIWVTRYQPEIGDYVTTCLQSGVKVVDGKVSFNFGSKGFVLDSGYQFKVCADVVDTLTGDTTFSLTIGSGWKARELDTGRALKKVAMGGGEGQIQIYTSQSPVFNLKAAATPGVYVSEVATGYGWEVSAGARNLVFDVLEVYAKDVGAYVNQVVVAATPGYDLENCTNWKLWWTSNGVNCVLANGRVEDNTVIFDFKFHVAQDYTSRLEVHADLAAQPVSTKLQVGLRNVSGVMDDGSEFAIVDGVFAEFSQPVWSWQLPSKSPTDIENLLAQIAQLQAQLLALQGGGLG